MALSRRQERAYREAWHRHAHGGGASPGWQGSEDEVAIWMQAFDATGEVRVSPWDALLLAVRRRANRVNWVDSVIAELLRQQANRDEEEGRRPGETPPSPEVQRWMAESRNEERLLIRAGKMAIDAGVADAVVRRLELEGRLVTDALVTGLDSLDLTPEQRLEALSAMHARLALDDGRPDDDDG